MNTVNIAKYAFDKTQPVKTNYNKVVYDFNRLRYELIEAASDLSDQLSIIWFNNAYLVNSITNKYTSGVYSLLSVQAFQEYLNNININGGSVNCPSDCQSDCSAHNPCISDGCGADCETYYECGCNDCDCGDCASDE